MPPIINPPTGSTHPKGTGICTFTMKNAHTGHAASQVNSWRVKVGSFQNGYDHYLGGPFFPNGNNQQNDPGVRVPGGGVVCYAKVEYRKVANGSWYNGPTWIFTCTG